MSPTGFSVRERTYSITEVEQISGLAAHTLRWYEELGLIDDVSRGAGGRRVYTDDHLRWLEFLSEVRTTGMSVAEMTRYAALTRAGDRTIPDRRALVERHRDRLQLQFEELAATLQNLDRRIERYRHRMAGEGAQWTALTSA